MKKEKEKLNEYFELVLYRLRYSLELNSIFQVIKKLREIFENGNLNSSSQMNSIVSKKSEISFSNGRDFLFDSSDAKCSSFLKVTGNPVFFIRFKKSIPQETIAK